MKCWCQFESEKGILSYLKKKKKLLQCDDIVGLIFLLSPTELGKQMFSRLMMHLKLYWVNLSAQVNL